MLKTLEDLDISGKKVLVRVDFNVPIDESGNITDDFRIRSALPTIKYLLEQEAKQVILMSHLDPWDEVPASTKDPRLKLDKVAVRLSKLIEMDVAKMDDCIDIELPETEIVVLENLRFYKEEKSNDQNFAEKLSKNGEIYINDAFGTCHRAHASVEAITNFFKEKAAGLLVQKEVEMLSPIIKNPQKPFYLILGGTKVKDKINVINNLAPRTDRVLIGGRMALAFEKALYIDEEEKKKADELYKKFSTKLLLPSDYVLEDKTIVIAENLAANKKALDVGPETLKKWKEQLKNASTIVWNGPLGKFEESPFNIGTKEIATFLSKLKATTIIGGGDSASAVRELNLDQKMSHVSTGGGASLEFLEGKQLPGLKALGFYS